MAQDDDVGLLGVDTSLTRTASKYEEVRNPERRGDCYRTDAITRVMTVQAVIRSISRQWR